MSAVSTAAIAPASSSPTPTAAEIAELLPYLTPGERRELDALLHAAAAGAPKLSFVEFVTQVSPRYQWYRHCRQLAAVLQQVADGERSRVMVFMPPRHGKSELTTRLFPAYYLYRHPERWVGINSYAAELAYTFSRAARENYLRAGGPISGDAAAVKHWETGKGGGLWAAGVGGPITGKGFHLGIIDDPLKNAEEAASETVRASHQDWYNSTFYTREEPGAAIIVILTRWHEADLAGWLLSQEEEEPERWHIVNFEAIKEASPPDFPPTCTLEPDPREVGEALCPERRPLEKLRSIAKRIGSYFWNALFQQRPRPQSGGMFQRAWFTIVDAVPADVVARVRYWDKAGTQGGGAYSAGVKMSRGRDGILYVEHVERGQWSSHNRNQTMRTTAQLDGVGTTVWTEQEPGSGGKESAEATVLLLAGFDVHTETATGDKVTRARPFSAQAEAGNVRLVRGPWNKAYLDELEAFPHGTYKDQVDGSSGACNKVTLEPTSAGGWLV